GSPQPRAGRSDHPAPHLCGVPRLMQRAYVDAPMIGALPAMTMAGSENEMANSLAADVQTATTWSIALSVLMIGAGMLAIGLPMIAGAAVTALVGWLLIFSGLFHLAFAWRAGRPVAVLWQSCSDSCTALSGFTSSLGRWRVSNR